MAAAAGQQTCETCRKMGCFVGDKSKSGTKTCKECKPLLDKCGGKGERPSFARWCLAGGGLFYRLLCSVAAWGRAGRCMPNAVAIGGTLLDA